MSSVLSVWCTFDVEMLHCWPDAPMKVFYLRYPHRHIFKFRVELAVSHSDRDIEFILKKAELKRLIEGRYRLMTDNIESKMIEGVDLDTLESWVPSYSCEDWANVILSADSSVISVECSEDGENGGTVRRLQVV